MRKILAITSTYARLANVDRPATTCKPIWNVTLARYDGASLHKFTSFQGLVFVHNTGEENHGVESHKNLVGEEYLNSFSFLRWLQKQRHGFHCSFNCVFNTDRGFNAAFRTSENKMVMCSIASKLDWFYKGLLELQPIKWPQIKAVGKNNIQISL